MDRGAWQATIHGIARVRHDLVTKERETELYMRTRRYSHVLPSLWWHELCCNLVDLKNGHNLKAESYVLLGRNS